MWTLTTLKQTLIHLSTWIWGIILVNFKQQPRKAKSKAHTFQCALATDIKNQPLLLQQILTECQAKRWFFFPNVYRKKKLTTLAVPWWMNIISLCLSLNTFYTFYALTQFHLHGFEQMSGLKIIHMARAWIFRWMIHFLLQWEKNKAEKKRKRENKENLIL